MIINQFVGNVIYKTHKLNYNIFHFFVYFLLQNFKFKTILPGVYPAGKNWYRPPHIHFKISKPGYIELITQMYFPGHKLNKKDLLLKQKTRAEQQKMIASRKGSDFRYDIILKGA